MDQTNEFQSTGEVAQELRAQSWQVARLFELHVFDEPERVAGRRMIPRSLLPAIRAELARRGWTPETNRCG
jgi:hypothetical protein